METKGRSQSRRKVEYTLLGNGLDFIWSALQYLSGNPKERDLKYAVLHLCSGIELVLKERLRREHWSLVFDEPKNASKESYESGDFTSVTFKACFMRLINVCGVNIKETQKKVLLRFRDKRNQLEHFGVVASIEALKADAAAALSFLLDFINSELKPQKLSTEDITTLRKIRRKLSEFRTFISKRWNIIESQIKAVKSTIVM